MFDMGKRDSETEERPSHSAAKVPRLSPSTPPAPRASREMIQSEEENGILGLLDLPDEVIQKIFAYLPVLDLVVRVRLTCKRLHELSHSSCLWRDLTFSYDAHKHDASLTYYKGLLNQTCLVPQYRDCERDGGGDGDDLVPGKRDCTHQVEEDTVQNRVISLTLKVTERCMNKTPVNSHSILTQLLACPRLQQLKLKVNSLHNTAFLNQHRGLRSLTIDTVHSKGCLTNVFTHLKLYTNLRTLQLQISEWEEPLDSVKTTWVAMKDYFQTRPALTRLRLDIPVNDDMFTTILDCCEKLEDIQLSNGHLTRRFFKKMLISPNICLTALRLKGCPLTDPSMVYAIAQSFRHLKQLELSVHVPSANKAVWLQANDALLSRRIFPDMTVLNVEVKESLSDIQLSIQQENDVNGVDEPLPKVTCPAVPTEDEGRLEDVEYVVGDFLNLWFYLPRTVFQPHLRSLVVTSPNPHPLWSVAQQNSGVSYVSDDVLQGLVLSCQQLQHVDLRVHRMLPTGLAFLRTLPHLKTLRCFIYPDRFEKLDPPANGDDVTGNSLRCLELKLKRVDGEQLRIMCSYFPRLTSLTITMSAFIAEDCHLAMIVNALPRLDDLTINVYVTTVLEKGTAYSVLNSFLLNLFKSSRELRNVTMDVSGPDMMTERRTCHRPSINTARHLKAAAFRFLIFT